MHACGSILNYNKSTILLNYLLNMSHSAVLQAASGSQPTITTALGRRVCHSTKAEGIPQRIGNMISTDLLPINVVDGQGFREVIKNIEPGYNIPSRTTITIPRGSKLRQEEGCVENTTCNRECRPHNRLLDFLDCRKLHHSFCVYSLQLA